MVVPSMAGAEDTIYLCNFRVSVDGDWLCLKELADGSATVTSPMSPGTPGGDPRSRPLHVHSAPSTPTDCSRDIGIASLVPPALFAPYTPLYCERDPVSIERSNLVNICKLVVKELIESSLKYGRMLDSDSVPLQHFFIVLEHVLRHGLKPKRGILGPKKELWDLFQLVEKWTCEAADITASVRDLPTVSTHIGRARAWLRLALMQKKLPDYFRLVLEHRDELLTDFYEPGSLMLSDEAIVIMGLLVGLNVIDCNLCVKEEDLDSQMGVIDFSLYLRTSSGIVTNHPAPSSEAADMTTVLDQKNYIEELNGHLNATVTNLQAKLESMTTTNALMKEDLAIAKTNLQRLQIENDKLRSEHGIPTQVQQEQAEREAKKASRISVIGCEEELQDLKRQLEEEAAHRRQIERELELQVQMKAESEMAVKLLEKDIHQKQDTIIDLREQLDDIKVINLDMYHKLQECETSIRGKTELITKMQERQSEIGLSMQRLQNQLEECEREKSEIEENAKILQEKMGEEELKATTIQSDLLIEKEWRQALQETSKKEEDAKLLLKVKEDELQKSYHDYESLKSAHAQLIKTVEDQERTLEELGAHLSESKLEVSEFKDLSKNLLDAQWTPDNETKNCQSCQKEFSLARRRHHCRHCGLIFCHKCSDSTMPLASSSKPVRVCDGCHMKLLERHTTCS